MERMRGEEKGIEMPTTTTTTTLAYSLPSKRVSTSSSSTSPSSSSKKSSPTLGERRSDPPLTYTLVFNNHDPSHQPLIPPNQPQIPRTDPDLSTPIASGASNPPRTAPPTSSSPSIRYRECLRNHAASMGSHVVDGCGEFMPSGDEGTPESLKCAACDCHRNFHRKEVEGGSHLQQQQLPQPQHAAPNYHNTYKHNNGHNSTPSPHQFHNPPTSSSLHHQQHSHGFPHGVATPAPALVSPVMMAFGGGGAAAESSSEDLNMFRSNTGGGQFSVQPLSSPLSRKRFRTKFTQQQKDRMMEFAEKIGWKIQKHDEQEVQQFCTQEGVKRQVFKVWMHNNKQVMKKQQQQQM